MKRLPRVTQALEAICSIKLQMLQGVQLSAEQQSNDNAMKWRTPVEYLYLILTKGKKKNLPYIC